MYALLLTGWLVTGALPLGGVASSALTWALPLIAGVMLVLLALLASDTIRARPSRSWIRSLGRRGFGRSRRPTTLPPASCGCTTNA